MILVHSNVTGDYKVSLLVIKKLKNYQAFKKLKNKSSLIVSYKIQKNAWNIQLVNSNLHKSIDEEEEDKISTQ